jgi:hypothetical protein
VNRPLAAVAVAATLCASAAALAYVLPGGFVIGKVAEHRNSAGFSEMLIEGAATVATPSGEVTGEAQLQVAAACCVELKVLAGKRELSLTIRDGKVTAASPELQPLAQALAGIEGGLLAMFPGRVAGAELHQRVKALGVETDVTSLARFFGRVAFVLGAGSRDRASPQLWVDKDAYHALRMILPRKGSKETVDLRFIDYQQSPLPGRFPRTIEIASGQTLLFRLEADRVASGAAAADDDDAPKAAPAAPPKKKQGR